MRTTVPPETHRNDNTRLVLPLLALLSNRKRPSTRESLPPLGVAAFPQTLFDGETGERRQHARGTFRNALLPQLFASLSGTSETHRTAPLFASSPRLEPPAPLICSPMARCLPPSASAGPPPYNECDAQQISSAPDYAIENRRKGDAQLPHCYHHSPPGRSTHRRQYPSSLPAD